MLSELFILFWLQFILASFSLSLYSFSFVFRVALSLCCFFDVLLCYAIRSFRTLFYFLVGFVFFYMDILPLQGMLYGSARKNFPKNLLKAVFISSDSIPDQVSLQSFDFKLLIFVWHVFLIFILLIVSGVVRLAGIDNFSKN